MSQVGQIERKTQNRVVKLFREQLEYTYLGNWEKRECNSNIEDEYLVKFLKEKKGYSDSLISKALYRFHKAADGQNKSLYDLNKEVYSILRYGDKIKESPGKNAETIFFINWEKPLENDFYIAEEVTVSGEHNKRPDLVLYVNGIAIGVIELKRSTISVSEGIRQNLDNQQSMFIKQFFTTIQLIMAGNDTEGLRYGTIETPEKYYYTWKEDSNIENLLDRYLLKICEKRRLLEIIHDFIVFDRGIKKICRHNQYFAIQAAKDYLHDREGGIIWHSQGSGKSLIMVWLTKWIREHIPNARTLIITDREELDEQIEKIFKGVDEQIHRTTSGYDLIKVLNATTPWLMCSLIHKFSGHEEEDYDKYIEELKKCLPKDFKAKGDIHVFVDECHRTQSGKLHKAMKEILPDALLIGFTGTPLLKKDKKKSIEVFGPYIHTYKFDEAVKDGVILDLRYEARKIDQNITSQEKIDQWFDIKTKGLTDIAKNQLKMRWGSMKKILSAKDRLNKIVADIMFDMETKDRLQNGRGNALLVSGSIYQACRYYELFQEAGLKKCAIITSYKPSIHDINGESTGEEGYTEKLRKYEIYQKMLNGRDIDAFEADVKKKFVEEPAQMRLLIVVDKLLTGFDAPPATYLYIDKKMRDHGLFQAICRVNRLDGEDKEYGYVIDYKDLFKSLEKSVYEYTSEAFDQYDTDDVKGLLTNRLKNAKEQLENALDNVKALCEPVDPSKDTNAYIKYFCGNPEKKEDLKDNEQKRLSLYKLTSRLIRSYANIANEMSDAGYSNSEIISIKNEVAEYEQIRMEIKLASGDAIDLKAYEPAMRHLIDTYISAEESQRITAFDDMSLVQLIVERGEKALDSLPTKIRNNKQSVAETIENNLRKVIIEEKPTNPKYFNRMSVLLAELIQQRKQEVKDYEDYLKKILELTKKITQPQSSSEYPSTLKTSALRALYDNLDKNESLAIALDNDICNVKKDGWRGNRIKEREVKNAIKKHIRDEKELEHIFEIVKNQRDY